MGGYVCHSPLNIVKRKRRVIFTPQLAAKNDSLIGFESRGYVERPTKDVWKNVEGCAIGNNMGFCQNESIMQKAIQKIGMDQKPQPCMQLLE